MVNHCPDEYNKKNVIARCEDLPLDREAYSYLQDIPVHSLTTDLVYANIFCAICHQDWNLTITKAVLPTLNNNGKCSF